MHVVVGQVDIGGGVLLPCVKLVLIHIRSDRPTVLMCHLMDLAFTEEEMACSSVTGRSSSKNPQKKEQLNPDKVAAILGN